MAKQKIVMKVTMKNNKKIRKAMKIAATISGVESVAYMGTDKEEIVVTGEGIDSVELTCLLRKSVGHTELVSVGPVKEEKSASEKESKEREARFEYVYHPPPYYRQFMSPYQVVHEVPPYNSCNIL